MVGTKLAPPTGSGAKLTTRLLAALMALVLCVGLMPTVPAWADDATAGSAEATTSQATGTATLTIVAGSQTDWNTYEVTYDTWVNNTYEFEEGATVKDLLDAAVAASDLGGYASSESKYGLSLDGITSAKGIAQNNAYGSSTSAYWALYVDGGYASYGFADTKLEDGHAYQLAWTSYSSIATPSSVDEWKAYYGGNASTGASMEEDGATVLTIVAGSQTDWNTYETTYDTWTNKGYLLGEVATGLNKDASELTIADLLAYAVQKGDLKDVSISKPSKSSMLDGITSSEGVTQTNDYAAIGGSLYWAVYERGELSNTGIDAPVEAGASYQIAWTFYSSISTPSSPDEWAKYYEANKPGVGKGSAASAGVVERPADQYASAGIDSAQYGSLAANIASSYAGLDYTGTTDAWKYMALAAIGQAASVDKEAYLSTAIAEMRSDDSSASGYMTRFQRNIIALTALGYDATALPDGEGTYNAIEAMAQNVELSSFNNVLIFTLIAYECGGYEVPDDAKLSESALVSIILSKQFSNGGFAFNGDSASVDMTSYAINALASYQDEYPAAADAINGALSFLKNAQQDDGGFGYYASDDASNVYSTATAIVALCAAGVDPADSWATESGLTPMSSLLSFAASDLSGFVSDGEVDDMATQQGFCALVAYQGLKNTGAAYNIYTQAAKGQAALPGVPADSGDDASSAVLAQTGDDSAPVAGVAAAALLGALACALTACRKMDCAQVDELIAR